MNRVTRIGVLVVFGLTAGLAGAGKLMTVKQIMGKLNKGPNALTPSLKRSLQQDQLDWKQIQDQSKEYANLSAELTKTNPPRGDKASWEKLTQEYAAVAKSLETASANKDKAAALAAHSKLTKACSACHKVHRPQ
jgi:hypothetical protein